MSKAIIIFADGSKQMAHNLDDQRFRWYERRLVTYQDLEDAYSRGIAIRTESEPDGLYQAGQWRAECVSQIKALENQRAILKQQKSSQTYEVMHTAIILTQNELQGRISRLNAYIKSEEIAVRKSSDFLREKLFLEEQARKQAATPLTFEQLKELAEMKRKNIELANTAERDEHKQYSKQLKKEIEGLRGQLIVSQSEVIRLQSLLIEQFGVPMDIVMPEPGATAQNHNEPI